VIYFIFFGIYREIENNMLDFLTSINTECVCATACVCSPVICSTGCVDVATDIILKTGAVRCIAFGAISADAGTSLSICGNHGAASCGGGNILLYPGSGGTTKGAGGSLVLCGGETVSATTGGQIYINAGCNLNGTGGAVNICSGRGSIAGGDITLSSVSGSTILIHGTTRRLLTTSTGVCICGVLKNDICILSPVISATTICGLTISGTATCATTAGNALALCGCTPACFLGATATAANSLGLCGCTPACFLGATATASNSLALCGCTPACFLGATATATCATTAGNALCLGGSLANTYAPLASPNFTGGVVITENGNDTGLTLNYGGSNTWATIQGPLNRSLRFNLRDNTDEDGFCFRNANGGDLLRIFRTGNVVISGCTTSLKFIEGSTCLALTYLGINATAANSLGLCGCVPSCFLGASATATCATTAGNALCLGGALANTYAPLATPSFTPPVKINQQGNGTIAAPFLTTGITGGLSVGAVYPAINFLNSWQDTNRSWMNFSVRDENGNKLTAMTIDAGGCVGIGTPTPQTLLQVNGAITISHADQTFVRLKLINTDATGREYDLISGIAAYGQQGFSIYDATASATRLVITSGGSVGIGTITPQKELEISKSGGATVRITNSYDTAVQDTYIGGIEFWNNDADTPKVSSFIKSYAAETFGRRGYMTLGVSIANNTPAVEIMRLSDNGNVGIGTTSPATKLQVSGTTTTTSAIIDGLANGTNTYLQFKNGTAPRSLLGSDAASMGGAEADTTLYVYGANNFFIATNGGRRFCVDGAGAINASSTITATNFILSSDEKQKTNIVPLTIAPINIEYKQFELISEPNVIRYGVIAQELQKTNPELIRCGKDGIMSVAYIDLLVKEIASLKSRVCELERKLE
jgi:hypothetical protein